MFHYFVPVESGGLSEARMGEVGLGGVLGDATVSRREVAEGPGGLRGMLLVGTSGESVVPRYEAGEREWVEIPSGYWLGWDPKALPGPEELARRTVIDGYELKLGDGNRWMIPIARKRFGGSELPIRFGVSPDGSFSGTVLPQYARLYDLAVDGLELVRAWLREEEEEARLTYARMFEIGVEALSANYRVGPHEVTALGLINSWNAFEIFKALADLFPEEEKKTASGS